MSRVTQLPLAKEVIEERLITRDTLIGAAPSASKMGARVALLVEAFSMDEAAKEKAYQELLKDFRTMALEVSWLCHTVGRSRPLSCEDQMLSQ